MTAEPYQLLEQEWAAFNGVPPECMAVCSSGSAALHLALECLCLPPGSEVIVPTFSMIAAARAVTLAGLRPVFVDCGDDLLMDPGLVAEAAERPKVAAILPVHVYGRRCDMAALAPLAEGAGLWLVEDLAEAHGVRPHPETDVACWSFQRTKVVHGEEGGAVAFRLPAHAALARSLRDMGFAPERDYWHAPRGWNYRLANLLAAPIRGSLLAVEASVVARWRLWAAYDAACPVEWRPPVPESPWVYPARVPGLTAARQDAAVQALKAAGVAARHGFRPLHLQEEYRACSFVGGGNALRASTEVITLPLSPGAVTEADCARAFDVLRRALG